MANHVQAPLRNYQQMVRVVKDNGSKDQYQLANAYGAGAPASHTDLRLRTLDEMGLPGATSRRPAPEVKGGNLSRRASTSYYHELNSRSRSYFNGVSPPIVSRTDSMAGTKERTELGVHSFSKKIEPLISLSAFTPPKTEHKPSAEKSQKNGFSAFSSK